jgi:hypothetical protein
VALNNMPVTEWAAAIVVRHSARTYDAGPLDPTILEQLESLVESFLDKETARVTVVRNLPEHIFTGTIGHYGRVVGARSGIVIIGNDAQPGMQESAGYLGEAVILEATSRAIDSCWVDGYFDREATRKLARLGRNERVLAVSPLGHAQSRPRAGEKVTKRLVGSHKRRPVEDIAPGFNEETWPAWAVQGVRVARSAPSAMNRQPWQFVLGNHNSTAGASTGEPAAHAGRTGAVTISMKPKGHDEPVSRRLDCGIAMLHFEVGARLAGVTGHWKILESPQVARYRIVAAADASGRSTGSPQPRN